MKRDVEVFYGPKSILITMRWLW